MKIERYCFLLGFILLCWNVQAQYTINGKVEGENDGRAFLIKRSYQDTADTLAKVDVKEGKFTMKGRVDEIICASLVVEGMLGTQLFLENGNVFDVKFIPMKMPAVEGGGQNQQLSREYMNIETEKMMKLRDVTSRRVKASMVRDSVSLGNIREEQEKIIQKSEERKNAFLKQNGNTFFVLHDLARRALGMNVDDVREAFDLCSNELKATAPGKYITALLPKLAKIAIGATVPDFISTTPEGKEVALYSVKSKVKLIDFWSSNCGRCRVENRLTVPIYEKYHTLGFDVISYSLDKKRELWLKAIADDRLPWTQVSDLGGKNVKIVTLNYGIWSLPANLLVDENNKVIARNITSGELEKLLPKLLGIK